MKKILIALGLLQSTQVFALDLNNQVNVGELNYFPAKGTVYGSSSLTSQASEYDEKVVDSGTTTSTNEELSRVTLQQNIGFAPVENLFFGLGVTYATQELKSKSPTGATATLTYESSGLKEPELSVHWRALKQEESGLNLVFALGYSPDIGKGKVATSSKKGNEKNGGSAFAAGINFGTKYTSFAYKLSAEMTFNGENESELQTANVTAKKEETNDLAIALDFEIPAGGEGWFVNVGAGAIFTEGYKTTFNSTTTYWLQRDAQTTLTLYAGILKSIRENMSIAGSVALISSNDVKTIDTSMDTVEQKDIAGAVVHVELNYTF